ncbi:MAG: glutathione S-transferase [Marinovum sp.]|nr:glutathione S-transferase [Marinovum sp.]
MTDILYIGDYAYSTWSLRGWLFFDAFGLSKKTIMVPFGEGQTVAEQLTDDVKIARTVPCVALKDGAVVWDSMAIGEELASRHPDAGLWPKEPKMRALARSLAAEMHSGFTALRTQCPMNVRLAYSDVPIDDALDADLARLQDIWHYALDVSGGPWLAGEYSIADAFFAPVAGRIAGFSLPVSERCMDYVQRHLNHGPFRRWRSMGFAKPDVLPWYVQPYETVPWPGPALADAEVVDTGPAANELCPYSGKPVTHFLTYAGRTWGVCNAFCRDKTVADPEAWPAFMKMVQATP